MICYNDFPNDPATTEDLRRHGRYRPMEHCPVCMGLVREKTVLDGDRIIGFVKYCTDCHASQGVRYTEEYMAEIAEEEGFMEAQRKADLDMIYAVADDDRRDRS